MSIKDLFKKKPKEDPHTMPSAQSKADVPEGIMTKCPECKHVILTKDLIKNGKVCPVWVLWDR